MIARKEIRDERTDVIGFYEITKALNETQMINIVTGKQIGRAHV